MMVFLMMVKHKYSETLTNTDLFSTSTHNSFYRHTVFVMATSSSDESTAPKHFILSSSADSGSRLDLYKSKCPLCCNLSNMFYCRECVRNGVFFSSNSYNNNYSFSTKQLQLLQMKSDRKDLITEYLQIIEDRQKYEELISDVKLRRERIRIYKLTLEEKRKEKEIDLARLKELKDKNKNLVKFLPKYAYQVDKLETDVLIKKEKVVQHNDNFSKNHKQLKKISRHRIEQIVQFVFPIERIQPKSVDTELIGTDDVVSAITEAVYTTHVNGDRWVYTDNSSELQYSIVAPLLPGSGNFEAYNIWVTQTRGGVPANSTSQEHHPAYSISAALTYTAQLLNVIAFYLDIRLPYKMIYSDFCTNEMDSATFSRRVSRLNANALHLCYSQNVDLDSLNPVQSLHNILQLIDAKTTDLGRYGPFQVDCRVANALEKQIGSSLQTGEDSDSEEGDIFPYEWEAVPHVELPEASPGPMNSTQTLSTQQGQMNSIAGGLYTSAASGLASIWRGFTGR
ncbi:PREDICTED: beclin 1-associated autophagy-related key regulator isoform X2 [Nicrophorus vespilloides]|uniref:Beclin 1-associated autophagy-related key regulator isoform X2 n=1 Tax=Nicrophorus vespilloides TaxID=110193 RepID=A0ABM1N3H2_NICVS|nr:PREDICTED: beclin 1-associated autophagy-related key regulator isoform X2 [Nicrophorus vespilloides]